MISFLLLHIHKAQKAQRKEQNRQRVSAKIHPDKVIIHNVCISEMLHSVSVSVTFASVVASAIISEEVSNGHSRERERHQIFNTLSHLSSAVCTSGGSMNFKKTLALQIKMCPKKQHKRDTFKKKALIHLHQINRKLKRD